MNINKVISSTQFNRPEYTKRMLSGLKNCNGIEDYLLVISLDKSSDEVLEMCSKVDFCDSILILNDPKLGCNKNTENALNNGFLYSDYVIHVEDDILLSKSSLELFENLCKYKRDDIFSISLYNRLDKEDVSEEDKKVVLLKNQFVPWGFALWRESFEKIKHCFECNEVYKSWDWQISDFVHQNNMANIFTMFSRVDNIGAENGVHVPSAEWHYDNHRVPYWAGMEENDDISNLRLDYKC